MNITIGAYKSQDGRKAEVVDIRGQVAIGWIGLIAHQWLINCGTCICGGKTGSNLIAVWSEDPKLRPWKVEEVPLGYLIRAKGGENICLIIDTTFEARRLQWLIDYEHSTDGGKTWKPCGVEVKL